MYRFADKVLTHLLTQIYGAFTGVNLKTSLQWKCSICKQDIGSKYTAKLKESIWLSVTTLYKCVGVIREKIIHLYIYISLSYSIRAHFACEVLPGSSFNDLKDLLKLYVKSQALLSSDVFSALI